MKTKTFLISLILTMPLLATACSGSKPESAEASSAGSRSDVQSKAPEISAGSASYAHAEISSDISAAADSSPSEVVPAGEPTIFTDLVGNIVLTSEITAVEDTGKAPADITENDCGAAVICDGFAFVKEPTGIGYDNYRSPELFDGYRFKGELPENSSKWRRVCVGDEICGMKVKAAASCFTVNGLEEAGFPGTLLRRRQLIL